MRLGRYARRKMPIHDWQTERIGPITLKPLNDWLNSSSVWARTERFHRIRTRGAAARFNKPRPK